MEGLQTLTVWYFDRNLDVDGFQQLLNFPLFTDVLIPATKEQTARFGLDHWLPPAKSQKSSRPLNQKELNILLHTEKMSFLGNLPLNEIVWNNFTRLYTSGCISKNCKSISLSTSIDVTVNSNNKTMQFFKNIDIWKELFFPWSFTASVIFPAQGGN